VKRDIRVGDLASIPKCFMDCEHNPTACCTSTARSLQATLVFCVLDGSGIFYMERNRCGLFQCLFNVLQEA
jgi:hypothetical protein